MDRSKSGSASEIKRQRSTVWYFCGRETSRSALVFICQIFILYVSIITCFINLSIRNGSSELWITILSLSLGSILPSPKVKKTQGQEENNYYDRSSSSSSDPSIL